MIKQEKFVTKTAAEKLYNKLKSENKNPEFVVDPDPKALAEGYTFEWYIVTWKE